MPKVRPLEVRALLPLLEYDWDDEINEETGKVIMTGQERLVSALILALDKVRASRTSYVGVMQIGGRDGIYLGIGPYPGSKSAAGALQKHPGASLATGLVVVPIETPEGLEKRLKELDEPPSKTAA